MRLKTTIYALTDPRDGLTYYVGQSRQGLKRAYRHRTSTSLRDDGATPKTKWIRSLIKAGLEYDVQVLEETHATHALLCERQWIDKLRDAGHPLTNAPPIPKRKRFSKQHRRRLSEAAKLRGQDPEYRRKMANVHRGRLVSDETRARQSVSQKHRARTLVEKKRRSALAKVLRTGTTQSDATRLAIAHAHGAKPFEDQFHRRFESVRQAARVLELDSSSISKVLRGKLSHTKGYVFTYLQE
jgi:hypothetical protein